MAASLCYLLGVLVCIDVATAFSTGPPTSACDGMAPNPDRHNAQKQNSSAPYNVTIDVPVSGATTGQSYTVTISPLVNGTTFKGFMCQVRKHNDTATTAIGLFTTFDTVKAKNLDCTTAKGAVVHKNANDVSIFTATWQAPDTKPGDYNLRVFCTIVQVKVTYWVKVPSAAFSLEASPTVSPPPTTESPPTTNTTESPPTTESPRSGSQAAPTSFGFLVLAFLLRVSFD